MPREQPRRNDSPGLYKPVLLLSEDVHADPIASLIKLYRVFKMQTCQVQSNPSYLENKLILTVPAPHPRNPHRRCPRRANRKNHPRLRLHMWQQLLQQQRRERRPRSRL